MAEQLVRLFGEFVVDTARGYLTEAGHPVHLRPQAYRSLVYLAGHAGRIVTKNELVNHVWEGRAVTDDSLVQCIGDIRKALRDDRGTRLRTVRGRGYVLDVEPANEPDAARGVPAPEPADSPPTRRRFVPAALIILAVAAPAGIAMLRQPRSPASARAADAGTFVKLTSSDDLELRPSLSPDGSWLLFDSFTPTSDEEAQLYIRPVDGGRAVCLTCDKEGGGSDGAFSPSGDLIAYARSDRRGLVVMARDGTQPRLLAELGFHPTWSPDGKSIAFATRPTDWIPVGAAHVPSDLWVVDVASGARRRLDVGDARDPAWSPDGRHIAFWSQLNNDADRDVFVTSISGDRTTRVTEGAGDNWLPAWAADGRALYFVTNRAGSTALWRVPIEPARGAPLDVPQPVGAPTTFVAYPRAGATGDLVYSEARAERNVILLSFDAATATINGPPRHVTQTTDFWMMPRASAHGEWIAMSRAAMAAQEDLFAIRADGTGLRQLTDDKAFDRESDISPDGRRIAFESNRGGASAIWTMNADGSDLQPLTTATETASWTTSRWSPDGRHVAARRRPGFRIALFDAERPLSPPHAILPLPDGIEEPPSMALSLTRLAWSPDGKQLAAKFGAHIVIYSLDTGASRAARMDGGIVGWPEGPFLLVDQWADRRLVLLDTRTWRQREIPYEPFLQRDDRLSLSGDGRTLVVEHGTYKADVWLMRAARVASSLR